MSAELVEEEQEKRVRHTVLVAIILFIGSSTILWNKTTGPFEYRLGATLGQTIIILIAGTAGFYSSYHPKNSKEREKKKAVKFYNEGLVLSKSGDYEKALAAYNQALTFNDKDPDIWNNKCYVLTKLGKFDEAVDAGKVAVQLAPNDTEIRNTLQTALAAKGK